MGDSGGQPRRPEQVSDDELVQIIENLTADSPFTGTPGINDHVDLKRSDLLKRLHELENEGRVASKYVGGNLAR